MVRFTPDTLRDAFWRPISMAAPDGGVYIEIMAPDVRFACIAFLTVVIAALAVFLRRKLVPKPLLLLLVFTWAAFVPWLATTGNGRYFIPVLILAGPLCIGLIHKLPATAALKVAMAAIVVGVQGFAVVQADPRGSWPLAPWRDTYFDLALTSEEREQPAAYALVTNISYSLLAPQFDSRSRWVGLSSLPANPLSTTDGKRAQAALERASADGLPLKVIVPTVLSRTDAAGQPDAGLRAEMNRLLKPHRLALAESGSCALRKSATMAARLVDSPDPRNRALAERVGFWICPLRFPVDAGPDSPAQPVANPEMLARADRVFGVMERLCPRFFAPGETSSVRIEGAFERRYSSDTRAYVTDEGHVYYRYWRALNANDLGTAQEVLAAGFTMNCNQMRGRSGLPWERQL
jgi:hypothetical protein